MINIKRACMNDAEFMFKMTLIEKWGYKKQDFIRLMNFEPYGCFIAWKNNMRVGMVTTTTYNDYAFLGCLMVRKEERGKGIGRNIMEHAIKYLKRNKIKTIELDGVFPAVSLYRRLGFRDKYLSLRFVREPDRYKTEDIDDINNFREELTGKIIEFDRKMTGISRKRVLETFLNEFGKDTFLTAERKISSYVILRKRKDGHYNIGPIISKDIKKVRNLIVSILNKYGANTLTTGVPEFNTEMVELLLDLNFKYNEPSIRMYLGERKDYEKHIYGILSPDKG